MNPNVLVTLTPQYPATTAGLVFNLDGDAQYKPIGTGSGGWQIVDRPRSVSALQWYDRSPKSLTLKLVMTSEQINGYSGGSIESACQTFETWTDKVPGTVIPPILAVSGPVPGIQYLWAIYDYEFGPAIRDSSAGYRVQQNLSVTLYEYNAPLNGVLGAPTPVIAWIQTVLGQNTQSSYLLYTVRAGDTLSSIAAFIYGDQSKWSEIAALNNLRDPNNIYAGQTLKLPQN